MLALIVASLGYEHAVTRRIFVGRNVNPSVVHRPAIKKILAGRNAGGWRARLQIHQKEFTLGPALRHRDQQQASVVIQTHARPILRIAAFAKNFRVRLRIASQFVIEHMPVVHLLSLRHVTFLRIARVIKTRVVEHPCDAARTRPLDRIGQRAARPGFDNVQRAHLRSARRSSVRQISSILRRLIPIQRDGSVRGKLVRIHQHPIFSIHAFPHIEHRLVLHSLAPHIKIIFPANLRLREAANAQQFSQPLMNRLPSRQRIKYRSRIRHLLRHPLLRVRILPILQPPVVINNLHPVQRLLQRTLLRLRRSCVRGTFSIARRKNSRRQNHQRSKRKSNRNQTHPSTHTHLAPLSLPKTKTNTGVFTRPPRCYDECSKNHALRARFSKTLLSSSMAEHPAVNRRVVGSNPT